MIVGIARLALLRTHNNYTGLLTSSKPLNFAQSSPLGTRLLAFMPSMVIEGEQDPFKWFSKWFQEAVDHPAIIEANAMNIATCSTDGRPSSRWVLLKGYGQDGFRFFTNYTSKKGKQLSENPQTTLTFYWEPLNRQIRIDGLAEHMSIEASTKYFHSRPRGSQIGAIVSNHQSSPIPNSQFLEDRRIKLEEEFKELDTIPKPDYWGGFLIKPLEIEFYELPYNRIKFTRQSDQSDQWVVHKLHS